MTPGNRSRRIWALALSLAGLLSAELAAAPAAPAGGLEAAASEARVALVIGNADYANVPLKNPANDARDVAAALQRLGFSVTLLVDADFASMSRAIRDFGNAIKRPDVVALFYYSGHGVQYRGANYLIPAKADIQDPDELSFSAVNAEQVYAKMESAGDRTNIVILDACRNNPFPGAERASERGLAIAGSAPPQSLIVYSTAPGKTAQDGTGRNGVFTAALLKHLADPALDAQLMIRRVRDDVVAGTGGAQVPWDNSSISGSGFAFAGGGRLRVETSPAGAEVFVDGQRRGLSPLSIEGLPRYAEIEVSAKSGAKSAARRITLTDASETKLQLSLEVARGSILVSASERVQKALIDGSEVALGAKGAIEGVEVGAHSIELRGDSSVYRGKIDVGADAPVKLSAVLVPMGSLTLSLPEGASCEIRGMGLSDKTARFNYGELPAGDYSLSVSGGDYEDYAEKVTITRGQKLDFAPQLRHTTAWLAAKYKGELDRLQKAVDADAASQADLGDAASLAKRIKAEARPELEGLAAKAEAMGKALASQRSAQAASSAPRSAQVGAGTLTLLSDPPGMSVVVDSGATYITPASIELPAGAHSFEPQESYIARTWYAAQALQWITVSAGSEVKVPIRIKPAMARLEIKRAPEGLKVFVGDEEVGETPLEGEIDVKAGFVLARFEKAGEAPQTLATNVKPGDVGRVSWGISPDLAIILKRQTVNLDGKTDSWNGVEPIYEAEAGSQRSFMGEPAYGPKRVFMCRDDKYLYWRIDFNETNPLVRTPKGTGRAITVQLSPWFDSAQKNFDMAVMYNKDDNRTHTYLGSYNGATGKWGQLAENAISVKQSKDFLVARLAIDYVKKNCPGTGNIAFTLANTGNDWQWVESSKLQFNLGFVDFDK